MISLARRFVRPQTAFLGRGVRKAERPLVAASDGERMAAEGFAFGGPLIAARRRHAAAGVGIQRASAPWRHYDKIVEPIAIFVGLKNDRLWRIEFKSCNHYLFFKSPFNTIFGTIIE